MAPMHRHAMHLHPILLPPPSLHGSAPACPSRRDPAPAKSKHPPGTTQTQVPCQVPYGVKRGCYSCHSFDVKRGCYSCHSFDVKRGCYSCHSFDVKRGCYSCHSMASCCHLWDPIRQWVLGAAAAQPLLGSSRGAAADVPVNRMAIDGGMMPRLASAAALGSGSCAPPSVRPAKAQERPERLS